MTDPRTTWRRRMSFMWFITAPALVCSLIWALGRESLPPVEEVVLEQPRSESLGETVADRLPAIDPNAFHVRLWNPPPPPAKTQVHPTVVERPIALNLQLIGIIDSGTIESRRAAMYDPESDTLHIVANGERLKQHTIVEIAATYVEVQSGRQLRRLHLTPGTGTGTATAPGPGPGPGMESTSSDTAPAGGRGS